MICYDLKKDIIKFFDFSHKLIFSYIILLVKKVSLSSVSTRENTNILDYSTSYKRKTFSDENGKNFSKKLKNRESSFLIYDLHNYDLDFSNEHSDFKDTRNVIVINKKIKHFQSCKNSYLYDKFCKSFDFTNNGSINYQAENVFNISSTDLPLDLTFKNKSNTVDGCTQTQFVEEKNNTHALNTVQDDNFFFTVQIELCM